MYLLAASNKPGGELSTFWGSFLQTPGGKWRPAFSPIVSLLLDFFGSSFRSYQFLNELLLSFLAVSGFFLGRSLLGMSFWPSFFLGSGIALSPFAEFHILQIFGLMELLAAVFLMWCIYYAFKINKELKSSNLIVANVLFFLCIHTHERFVLLAPGFAVGFWLMSEGLNRRRFLLTIGPLVSVTFNLFIKAIILNLNVFTGAAGEVTEFSLGQTIGFLGSGLLSVLTYNSGPTYLSGVNAQEAGVFPALTVVIVASLFVLLLMFALKSQQTKVPPKSFTFVTMCLFLASLTAASISFRQEFRWLFVPQIMFFILIGGLSRFIDSSKLRNRTVLAIFLVLSISGVFYAGKSSGTYFLSTQSVADSSMRGLQFFESLDPATTTYIFITNSDLSFNWAVAGGQLFSEHFKESSASVKPDIRIISERSEIAELQLQGKTVVILSNKGNRVVFQEILFSN